MIVYVTKVEVVGRDWKGLLAAGSKVSPASVRRLLWLLLACGGCSLAVLRSDTLSMLVSRLGCNFVFS